VPPTPDSDAWYILAARGYAARLRVNGWRPSPATLQTTWWPVESHVVLTFLAYPSPGDPLALIVRQDTDLITRWHEPPFYQDLVARTARYRVIICYGGHHFELPIVEAALAPAPAEPVENPVFISKI
jgi:hypothetical protein